MALELDSFLHTEFKDSNATEYTPIPQDEYTAIIDGEKLEVRNQEMERDGQKVNVPILDVPWVIDDKNGTVKAATGMERNVVRQSIFLDVTVDGKGNMNLDFGQNKNVQLGRLRDALGMNEKGKPFSFGRLGGKAAKISVKHDVVKDRTYTRVTSVAALR